MRGGWFIGVMALEGREAGRDANCVASRPAGCSGDGLDWPVGAGAVGCARGREELDLSDHLVVVAVLPVVVDPLVVLEAAVDGDKPAGREDLGGGLAGLRSE